MMRYGTVIITGASSGIGAQLAREFASLSQHMVVTARREERLRSLAQELNGTGCQIHRLPGDLAGPESVTESLAQLLPSLPAPGLLILNAGIAQAVSHKGPFLETFRRVYDVNVFGAVAMIDAVLPWMLEHRQGHIVGVLSVAAYRGLPHWGPYCSSKAALWRALECLRLDLAHTGITVSTLHPSFVRTEMVDDVRAPMPFILPLPKAARIMRRAILRKTIHHGFPWQYRWAYRFLRPLPDAIYAWLFKCLSRIFIRHK